MLDKKEFYKKLALLFAAKNIAPVEGAYEAFYEVLKNYEMDSVCMAIEIFAKRADSFPTAGKILELITPDSTSEVAWNEALESAKSGGTIPLKHKILRVLNSLGGLMRIRDAKISGDEISWIKKEFLEAYKLYPDIENIYEIRCLGYEAKTILPDIKIKQLE